MPTSTVCAVLERLGLQPALPARTARAPNRYCRRHPGELIHIDIKKLGRFDQPGHRVTGARRATAQPAASRLGRPCHVAIDDTSRLAYVEILDDERAPTSVAFLRRAIAWFAGQASPSSGS